jgi:ABC-type multidrug transport system ATPase subunit
VGGGGGNVIEVNELRKVYGKQVSLAGVSFTVSAGERVALLGHNGAGKSTLMKLLAGQLRPTSGTVRVGGHDVGLAPDKVREALGYVPEEPATWDYLTAREMVEFVVAVRGKGDVEAALALTGLGADADRLIREYSQGMRRKVAIACAVVARPPVLMFDEALNGLDPSAALNIAEHLSALAAEGAAILTCTHVVDLVPRLAERVIVLRQGQVQVDARVDSLGKSGLESLCTASRP